MEKDKLKTITISKKAWKELRSVQSETEWSFSEIIYGVCKAFNMDTYELISEGLHELNENDAKIEKELEGVEQ